MVTGAELALQVVKLRALSVIRGSVELSVGGTGQQGTARTDRSPRTSAIVIAKAVPVATMVVVVDPQKHTIQSVASMFSLTILQTRSLSDGIR